MLNFFTPNCVPCMREHPELVEFAEQQAALGADGAELYTIVVDSEPTSRSTSSSPSSGGDWPIVYDADGRVLHRVRRVAGARDVDHRPRRGRAGRVIISEVTADGLGEPHPAAARAAA